MIKGVLKGGESGAMRGVIYGPPGIGKSTLGAGLEKVIMLCTEDGAAGLGADRLPVARTWTELLAQLQSVITDGAEYRTLVIDTLNGTADLAAAHICATQFKGDFGSNGFGSFGRGWAATSEEFRKMIPLLDAIHDRGQVILMLAHQGVVSVKNPVDGDYTKFAPSVDRKVWDRICQWADVVGRVEYESTIIQDNPKAPGRATSTQKRIIHFAGDIAQDAKVRAGFNFPGQMPLDAELFRAVLSGGAVNPELAALRELWPTLTPDRQASVLKYLKVKSLDGAIDKKRLSTVYEKLLAAPESAPAAEVK
jgi:hypothetical protein